MYYVLLMDSDPGFVSSKISVVAEIICGKVNDDGEIRLGLRKQRES
jgi:hypothetical protein